MPNMRDPFDHPERQLSRMNLGSVGSSLYTAAPSIFQAGHTCTAIASFACIIVHCIVVYTPAAVLSSTCHRTARPSI